MVPFKDQWLYVRKAGLSSLLFTCCKLPLRNQSKRFKPPVESREGQWLLLNFSEIIQVLTNLSLSPEVTVSDGALLSRGFVFHKSLKHSHLYLVEFSSHYKKTQNPFMLKKKYLLLPCPGCGSKKSLVMCQFPSPSKQKAQLLLLRE